MPLALYPLAPSTVAQFLLYVDDADREGFDTIQVWKSTLGAGGPYVELTAAEYSGATFPDALYPASPSPVGPDRNLADLSMEVRLNGSVLLSYIFTGTNPLTPAQVISQLNAAWSPYITAFTDTKGQVGLRTQAMGATVVLETLSGDAFGVLGIPTDTVYRGHDIRLPLISGQSQYLFSDYYGSSSDIYKFRLHNRTSNTSGPFSAPLRPTDVQVLPPSTMVRAYVKLVTAEGRPRDKTYITVSYTQQLQKIADRVLMGSAVKLYTGLTGYAETLLIRGIEVEVQIDGTNLAHRVSVPSDPTVTSFDLFDPAYATDDAFAVQRIHLPYAARRGT